MSHFEFLKAEFGDLHEAAVQTEQFALGDPRTACFHARRALELTVDWLYRHDRTLTRPYQDQLSALIHEPTFRALVGPSLFNKARLLKDLGNLAVHGQKPVRQFDGVTAARELFHVVFWVARTYSRAGRPSDGLAFEVSRLPRPERLAAQTREQLQMAEARFAEERAARAKVEEELTQLRDELARVKAANAAQPDAHEYSEAETRDAFIDVLLAEAGWTLEDARAREFPVKGMPNNSGDGFVDYVLWGKNGLPFAIVEAKRTRRSPIEGEQQAVKYADCLERDFQCRPLIFLSNGYQHWLWDDRSAPKREVQGFYTHDELEQAIQRRMSRKSMLQNRVPINERIVERYYQQRAILRVVESFERDSLRKALLVMATGAGKTRTAIALTDVLMRAGWVKRVLFLADRRALVKQAVNAFKSHLPDSSPVNLVTEREASGRVYGSTYPTMMGLIEQVEGQQRRFGVGYFDLVIIDEAHRSVFQKYRAIFDYFDALLVGLTATPVNEIHRNTYSLFELEDGVPTDAYDLNDAVSDHFLVPMKAVSVPLKFQRAGIRYDQLSADEQDAWDETEWPDDGSGNVPQRVEAEAVNLWLFNKDTVDKVLEHLMLRGQKVAGGDRLGKTIIFAKNQHHAEFIVERFDENYPHLKGQFARLITFKTEYAETLIDDFSKKAKAPHIAVSVDMLDTGIDVPEVVNLVFFKLVHSRTKFWQMIGRGTRLCADLFGPGMDKQFFYVFDFCGNLEFFSQSPDTVDGSENASLSKRLFVSRLELMTSLEDEPLPLPHVAQGHSWGADVPAPEELAEEVKRVLANEVSAMNVDNFIVRPHREWVERYGVPESWNELDDDARQVLSDQIAGLPTELATEPEEAKRFDLLMIRLQLAVLKKQKTFARLRDQVRGLVEALLEMTSIPMIKAQAALLEEVAGAPFWTDVTVPMLEFVRRRLRLLVPLIDKARRMPVYTDFEDELGQETEIQLAALAGADNFERFRAKARSFLRDHQDLLVIHKLRTNTPLTSLDLEQLETVLTKSGVGAKEHVNQASDEAHGLGLFVRSLVGLDREAAKKAFAGFLVGQTLGANQVEFINLIIDYLTEHGVMDPSLLYESPFTDLSPHGPDGLFTSTQVQALVTVLDAVRATAAA